MANPQAIRRRIGRGYGAWRHRRRRIGRDPVELSPYPALGQARDGGLAARTARRRRSAEIDPSPVAAMSMLLIRHDLAADDNLRPEFAVVRSVLPRQYGMASDAGGHVP